MPDPPWMLTPPTTAAAMAASSNDGPGGDVDRAELPEEHEAGQPRERPHTTNAVRVMRGLRQPDLASGVRIGTDRVHDAPDPQPTEDDLQHDRNDERDHEHQPEVEVAETDERVRAGD